MTSGQWTRLVNPCQCSSYWNSGRRTSTVYNPTTTVATGKTWSNSPRHQCEQKHLDGEFTTREAEGTATNLSYEDDCPYCQTQTPETSMNFWKRNLPSDRTAWILLGTAVILIVALLSALFILWRPPDPGPRRPPALVNPKIAGQNRHKGAKEEPAGKVKTAAGSGPQRKLTQQELRKLSRQSWKLLNRMSESDSDEGDEDSGASEKVLPAVMMYTSDLSVHGNSGKAEGVAVDLSSAQGSDSLQGSGDTSKEHRSDLSSALRSDLSARNGDLSVQKSDLNVKNGEFSGVSESELPGGSDPLDPKPKPKTCCKAQKYVQTITRPGCSPLRVLNRMCSGECLSVWIPGVFASFPTCRPSRSRWKTVTLTCGQEKRRVRVEKIRRCSCMEDEN